MTAPAAPVTGRRVSLGGLAVLAGFLVLAPPLYVLGPFALLTLLSRPRTARELFWLLAAAAGIALALSERTDFGSALIRASGVALAVALGLLSLRPRGPVLYRALAAVGLAAAGLVLWGWARGVSWQGVQQAFTSMLLDTYRGWPDLAPDPATRKDLENFIKPFLEGAANFARAIPGILAVEGLAGIALASMWHHRIAQAPLGAPPAPFRQFRFNDHLIWGAIFTLALMVIPLPPEGAAVALNLLVIWAGLYAARGLAVFTAILAPAPPAFKILAIGLGVLLNPIALGACVALGLGDTWLDVRRRRLPSAPGGA